MVLSGIKKFLNNPAARFKFLNRQNKWMSDEAYLKKLYYYRVGKTLNLDNPQTFNEKIQWLKLYDRKPAYTTMVDKYEAKKYVADIIGEEYIIPTLGVWDRFEDIDFDKLPEQFVLKCTHDSGGLVICRDKASFNKEAAAKRINKCLKKNYYLDNREWPYKDVKPRVIAEEFLTEAGKEQGQGLADYKIWCFNGKPVYVQYITSRTAGEPTEGFYDRNWQLQKFRYHNPLMEQALPRPKELEKLLELAEVLAQNTAFLRCDFYVPEENTIKFGELTFYPVSGMEFWHPEEMDEVLGAMISLPERE